MVCLFFLCTCIVFYPVALSYLLFSMAAVSSFTSLKPLVIRVLFFFFFPFFCFLKVLLLLCIYFFSGCFFILLGSFAFSKAWGSFLFNYIKKKTLGNWLVEQCVGLVGFTVEGLSVCNPIVSLGTAKYQYLLVMSLGYDPKFSSKKKCPIFSLGWEPVCQLSGRCTVKGAVHFIV